MVWNAAREVTLTNELRFDRLTLSVLEWALTGKGRIANMPVTANGFIKTRPELERPDMQIMVNPIRFDAMPWFPGIRAVQEHVFWAGLVQPEITEDGFCAIPEHPSVGIHAGPLFGALGVLVARHPARVREQRVQTLHPGRHPARRDAGDLLDVTELLASIQRFGEVKAARVAAATQALARAATRRRISAVASMKPIVRSTSEQIRAAWWMPRPGVSHSSFGRR